MFPHLVPFSALLARLLSLETFVLIPSQARGERPQFAEMARGQYSCCRAADDYSLAKAVVQGALPIGKLAILTAVG